VADATAVRRFDVRQEVLVEASPERVFDAALDITGWWGRPYLISKEATDIVLEPRPGGRVTEVWGKDQGALWATVTAIGRPRILELTGNIGIDTAVVVVLRLELTPEGDGTRVAFSLQASGDIPEGTEHTYGGGSADLLGRLKTFVETSTRQGLGHEPAWARGESQ
jgi:uncharacterized protein YndB with AHSA1/START domain